MSDPQLHGRIEQYLLGRLSAEDSDQLEAEMAKNPDIREQVEIQRLALMGLKAHAASDMRGKFREWDEELDAREGIQENSTIRFRYLASVAAALIFLLTSLYAWQFYQLKEATKTVEQQQRMIALMDSLVTEMETRFQEMSPPMASIAPPTANEDISAWLEINRLRQARQDAERLSSEQNKRLAGETSQFALAIALAPHPDSMFEKVRAADDDLAPILQDARRAYDNSNYSEAVRLLSSISPNDPLYPGAIRILPYALFYTGRLDEALRAFAALKEHNRYRAKNAEGFIMLCHLGLGQREEARKVLTDILDSPGHPFYEQAKKLDNTLTK